eukprot:CAMPEP_0202428168 /NCGR_PEP_ID=MMETSP1345-20130828/2236_1 /ASSEMBLY_ACC=CAM_ASM_000843 /TAXON_ID=342563 /ORGANISM="Fabrea Fabrea salina" /LENGTH=112 /DNA_ID=CAMNT_0049039077 /DNA_START=567 /DNA_END=906 /DNA_ORIENTATION=-
MIDIFLSENPNDKRPQEELKEVEQKNVFNQDKVNFDRPKPKAARLMPKNNESANSATKKLKTSDAKKAKTTFSASSAKSTCLKDRSLVKGAKSVKHLTAITTGKQAKDALLE